MSLRIACMTAVVLNAAAAALAAQQPAQPASEPKIVTVREVFTYRGGARRDPFQPSLRLPGDAPLFEDLRLGAILHSAAGDQSIALLQHGAKTYRVRQGSEVGHARVVAITERAVHFAISEFGITRRETLELRRGAEGALRAAPLAVPAGSAVAVDLSATDSGAAPPGLSEAEVRALQAGLEAERQRELQMRRPRQQ
jgi:hypothetical protein